MPVVSLETARARAYDVCIVGAGAAGLAVAASVRGSGLSVLLIERGGHTPARDEDEPLIESGVAHDPVSKTNRQGLGGTLNIWGGRCVPFDPVDFAPRTDGRPSWPISHADYAAWIARAAAFLRVDSDFTCPTPTDWPDLGEVRADTVEHLAPGLRLRSLWQDMAAARGGPDILLDGHVIGFEWEAERVVAVRVRHGVTCTALPAGEVVLACGGLQTTRLLLLEAAAAPGRIAGDAALGRTYMGHLTGSIAEVHFEQPDTARHFDYRREPGGTPMRRRFLVGGAGRPAAAFWIENVPATDPRHRSGELSAKALAQGCRSDVGAHVRNILRDGPGAAGGVASVVARRLRWQDRHPARLIARGRGPYSLWYHSEHLAENGSSVRLSDQTDRFGQPRLRIEFDYGADSVAGLIAAHATLADALQRAAFATLDYTGAPDTRAGAVRDQARDGYHQIGLTRMADTARTGVVDRDCRVFGTANLHVASASVFPVSGQANPTLSIVALSLRLAARLVGLHSKPVRGRSAA